MSCAVAQSAAGEDFTKDRSRASATRRAKPRPQLTSTANGRGHRILLGYASLLGSCRDDSPWVAACRARPGVSGVPRPGGRLDAGPVPPGLAQPRGVPPLPDGPRATGCVARRRLASGCPKRLCGGSAGPRRAGVTRGHRRHPGRAEQGGLPAGHPGARDRPRRGGAAGPAVAPETVLITRASRALSRAVAHGIMPVLWVRGGRRCGVQIRMARGYSPESQRADAGWHRRSLAQREVAAHLMSRTMPLIK